MGAHAGACTRSACLYESGRLGVCAWKWGCIRQSCIGWDVNSRLAWLAAWTAGRHTRPTVRGRQLCCAEQCVQEPQGTWPVFPPLQADYCIHQAVGETLQMVPTADQPASIINKTVSANTPLLCAAGASVCASAALAPSARDLRITLESSMGLKRSSKTIPAGRRPSRGCSPVGWPSCVQQLPIMELTSAGLQGILCCLLVSAQSVSKAVSTLSTCKMSCTACCRLLTLVHKAHQDVCSAPPMLLMALAGSRLQMCCAACSLPDAVPALCGDDAHVHHWPRASTADQDRRLWL